jgi:hypothetical protein
VNPAADEKGLRGEPFRCVFLAAYFSPFETLLKLLFRLLPTEVAATTITIEMLAAIKAYSMAVAPFSLLKRALKSFIRRLLTVPPASSGASCLTERF